MQGVKVLVTFPTLLYISRLDDDKINGFLQDVTSLLINWVNEF